MIYTTDSMRIPGEALVWFRREPRGFDHAALVAARAAHAAVHCAFVFDTEILDALASLADRRVTFIWDSVRELKAALEVAGGGLHVLQGHAREQIARIASRLGVTAVYANRDCEPPAIEPDGEVSLRLREAGSERYFADKLLDYYLAANNGGWQWSASTGCDAQPWFRIFNPVAQSQRFDPRGVYIRRWVPELARVADAFVHSPWEMAPLEQQVSGRLIGRDYPVPVVRHEEARQRTLGRYRALRSP
jgi:deoxyribodipyrimidine photolyase